MVVLMQSKVETTTKKTLSDHSIAAHITHLHRLSCRRFPASIPLWDSSLAHSLSQASPLLVSRTLSSVIAMHPTLVKYWIMASRWESEGDRKGMGGGNVEGARRLCMRGLRFLKGATGEMEIWREWIRLEVAYVEKIRARREILGIGKAEKETQAEDDEMEVDEEEVGNVELPLLPNETEGVTNEEMKNVEALSGQEAILDGAIVRVVLDNCFSCWFFLSSPLLLADQSLIAFSHSVESYQSMIILLRILPSSLRLSLLAHVYNSLRLNISTTSSSYAAATHLFATRSLYDVAYDPKNQEPKAPLQVDSIAATSSEIRVEGESFVDAVGAVVEEYWKACKGKKGKGKGKEKASMEVWESFCTWLEEMEQESQDENLVSCWREEEEEETDVIF